MTLEEKLSFFVFVSLLIIIFIVSELPGYTTPEQIFGFTVDSAIKHFLLFGLLGLLCANWTRFYTKKLWIPIIFSVIYGVSDEIHQSFVPSRYTTVEDVIVNTIGCVVGVLVFSVIYKKFYSK